MSTSGVTSFMNVPNSLTNMTSGIKMNLSSITKTLTNITTDLTNNASSMTTNNMTLSKTVNHEPEIGFTVDLNHREKDIIVTVVRGRHLPTKFGIKQVKGYFLKVKLYPGQKKYESEVFPLNSSELFFNEVFKFNISKDPNKVIDKDSSSKFEKFGQKFIQKFGQKTRTDDLQRSKEEAILSPNDVMDLNGYFVTITLCASMSDLIINENTYKAFKKTVDSYCETLIEKKNGNKKSKKENEKESNKKDKQTPERPTIDSKRTIGTVTCTLTNIFDRKSLERGGNTNRSKEIWKVIKDIREMRESLNGRQSNDVSPTSPNYSNSSNFFGGTPNVDGAAFRRCSVLDTSKGQVQISLSYGEKLQPPKTDEEEEKTESGFIRKSLSRFSLRRFLSQESQTDSKVDKEPVKEAVKESNQNQQIQKPANPFDRIITDVEDSDSEGEDYANNPFRNEGNEDSSNDVMNYLTVRVERIKCSRKVRDDLDLCGGHLYLKSYIADDDRKLVSLQCPKFVLTSLSRHFDPLRSSLAYPCDEVNLQYTSVKICLYNKDRLKKRTLLGSIKISEQEINELKSTRNQVFTKWYCIV